jgi:hypothetical protein
MTGTMPNYKDHLSDRHWWPYLKYGSLVLMGLLAAAVAFLALSIYP